MTSRLPTAASRIRVNDDVLFQELQGDGVLLHVNTGVYFGLDRVGTRVWQLIQTPQALSDIVTVIVEEFDVTPEQCTNDLIALVADLQKNSLVTLS